MSRATTDEQREAARLRCRAWYYANRDRAMASARAWKVANPDRARAVSSASYHRTKHLKDPEQEKQRKARYRQNNKEKCNAAAKEWRKANPIIAKEVQRWSSVKYRTGCTKELFLSLFNKQEGKCAICAKESSRNLHVDHCHRLGTVRGLLCGPCNRMIGMAYENKGVLLAAVAYLARDDN